jgi:senataxin
VTPYTAQITALTRALKRKLNTPDLGVEVKTVDGFQGREKDVIVFSTVRSSYVPGGVRNPKKTIGFLKDWRRMNVSLSRCRLCLVIVCDAYKLKHCRIWRTLIEYAMSLGNCYKVDQRMEVGAWYREFNANPLYYQMREFVTKTDFIKTK